MRILFRSAICICIALCSPSLYALGLGSADVRSYLNEPLDTRIALLGATPEELNSITASLASAADFEFLGITRTVSVPLRFRVIDDPANPAIEVSSRLPVKDPVVQLLLEVRWSGGRMLREYTLFIDPPTFAARAPVPTVSERRSSAQEPRSEREEYPDPDAIDVVETVKAPPATRVPRQAASTSEPAQDAFTQTGTASDNAPAVAEPEAGADQPGSAVPGLKPGDETPKSESVATNTGQATEMPESPAEGQEPDRALFEQAEAGEYGPVQRGETLWAIASDYARGTSYSVNQAMLAIQRMNPDAFGGNNINSLKRGEILRLPSRSELGRLNKRQAMAEAMRQEAAYRAMRSGQPYEDAPPLLADEALASGAIEPEPEPESSLEPPVLAEKDQPRLELVPPSLGEQAQAGAGDPSEQPTGATSSEELEEVLARTEEELANAQQENAYLTERIRELEEQIAEAGTAAALSDNEMAALESGLREKRLDETPKPESKVPANDTPRWLEGKTGWLIGILVLIIAGGVWLLRRMASPGAVGDNGRASGSGPGTVEHIRSEAEDILATLDPDTEPENEAHKEPGKVVKFDEKVHAEGRRAKPVDDTEVIELDTDDPETQLDLARAYISMGDPEAARSMLEAVLENGNAAQVEEARGMMEEL